MIIDSTLTRTPRADGTWTPWDETASRTLSCGGVRTWPLRVTDDANTIHAVLVRDGMEPGMDEAGFSRVHPNLWVRDD